MKIRIDINILPKEWIIYLEKKGWKTIDKFNAFDIIEANTATGKHLFDILLDSSWADYPMRTQETLDEISVIEAKSTWEILKEIKTPEFLMEELFPSERIRKTTKVNHSDERNDPGTPKP